MNYHFFKKNKIEIIFIIINFIILFPIFFFPFGCDNCLYFQGGQTIVNGGILYKDFIDLKPPMIYYLFAFINFIFGNDEFNIRIFDWIWQIFTIISIAYVLYSILKNKIISYIIASIYSLSYVNLNYSQTLQCENLISIFIIWIIFFLINKSDKLLSYLIIGILTGVISGFKYTFSVILLSIVIYEFITNYYKLESSKLVDKTNIFKKKRFYKNLIILFLGWIFGLILTSLPILLNSEIRASYNEILDYLLKYSDVNNYNPHFIRESLKSITIFFGDNYSLVLVICCFQALFYFFIKKIDNYILFNANLTNLFNLLFSLFLLLFFSITYEKKFYPYHFSRLYIINSILAGIGLYIIFKNFYEIFKTINIYSKFLLFSILIIALIFSPIPRFIQVYRIPIVSIFNSEDYDLLFDKSNDTTSLRRTQKYLHDLVAQNKKTNDFILIMATGSSTLNYYIKSNKNSKFSQSSFFTADFAPEKWRRESFKEMQNADWIILQNNDGHPSITVSGITTYDYILNNKLYRDYLNENFIKVDSVVCYIIYKRK